MSNRKKVKKHNSDPENLLDQEIDLQELKGGAEDFIEKNKALIFGILGLLLVFTIAYLAFTRVYVPGQEKGALEDMYVAQQYFEEDEYQKALEGDDSYPGFLQIIDSYSGRTKSVNLAKYYAGICYLKQGQFDDAIDYLKGFSSNDLIIGSMAKGAIGDAYMEKGDTENGISYYQKAAKHSDNEFSAPMFLMKAGLAMEVNNDFSGAMKMYEQVKDKYPNSTQGREIEKFIFRVKGRS